MSYTLGIDIGTTFTAAATLRRGRAQIVPLGGKADTIPSVVLLREDGTLLTGDAAQRRGISEPHRLAREFKRRFGQPEPVMLGGAPHSPEALTAAVLRAVVDEVVAREGGLPSRIALSHPANWGPFKGDLFQHVVRLAEVEVPVTFTTEPEAAAAAYAHEQRMEPGSIVAVYDLGGGTFDAAVLRKTVDGFEILGRPEGIEQLGGIDVDAAVFHHAIGALAEVFDALDEDDPAAISAVARLKRECVDAKEALSSDTDVSIPVMLPGTSTEVRLTRSELEQMVRPMLGGTIHALRRAVESAQVSADELSSVLLVGGASRMPIVAQLVGAELGRPVAIDTHPKHAVALGAAWLAHAAQVPASVSMPAVAAAPPAVAGAALFAGGNGAPDVLDEPPPSPRMAATAVMPAQAASAASAHPPARRRRRRTPVLEVLAVVLLVVVIAVGAVVLPRLMNRDAGQVATTATTSAADDSQAKLEEIVANDRVSAGELEGQWVPQVAPPLPNRLGVVGPNAPDADGTSADYSGVLAEYGTFKNERPEALLVWTADYPATFATSNAYAFLLSQTFHSAEAVVTWCEEQGYAPQACIAKRLSQSGDPAGNTLVREDTAPEPIVRKTTTSSSTTTEPTQTTTEPTETPTDTPTESPTETATGAAEESEAPPGGVGMDAIDDSAPEAVPGD